MRKCNIKSFPLIGILFLLVSYSTAAHCRYAQVFGFGPPPSYAETQELVLSNLRLTLRDPNSVQDLVIGKPLADCYRRGIGRRDVCGYKICVAYNAKNAFGAYVGRKVFAYWKLNGWGLQIFENQGACPTQFENWSGDSQVTLPDFCQYQGKHPDCATGRKEHYEQAPELPVDLHDDAIQPSRCSIDMREKMLGQGLTEADVSEICGCSSEVVDALIRKGLDGPQIFEICNQ